MLLRPQHVVSFCCETTIMIEATAKKKKKNERGYLSYKDSGIIMIVMTLKVAVLDFLQFFHCIVNCLQHVCSSGQGAFVCKSRETL